MKHAMNDPFHHPQFHDPVFPACAHIPQCIHIQRHVREMCLRLWEQTFQDSCPGDENRCTTFDPHEEPRGLTLDSLPLFLCGETWNVFPNIPYGSDYTL